ncbi:hypothetical protein K523DRAFT_323084 [Schizophyllum commune Tattone D]|nr:hypothetical protein K523DRAFT_323084 [Schizophyllum commune Tattone D]
MSYLDYDGRDSTDTLRYDEAPRPLTGAEQPFGSSLRPQPPAAQIPPLPIALLPIPSLLPYMPLRRASMPIRAPVQPLARSLGNGNQSGRSRQSKSRTR